MSDLWQRLQNILEETKQIKKCLSHANHYPPCCIQIHKDGSFQCSRYHLPKEEFIIKCEACRKEIKKFLENFD